MATDEVRPEAGSVQKKPLRRAHLGILLALLVSPLLVLGVNRLRYELRSYALLTHFVDPQATGPLLRFETNAVSTEEVAIATNNGSVPGLLYRPTGIAKPHGIVVLPGIHHLGIYDPRFINFSAPSPPAASRF